MKLAHDRDGIRIFHGDALDGLRAFSEPIDAVFTDPPYSSGASEAGKIRREAMVTADYHSEPIRGDRMSTPGFIWMMREVAARARELLVEGGGFVSFIDWRQWPTLVGVVESVDLRVHGMAVWDKKQPGMGTAVRRQHELLLLASKGTPRVFRKDVADVFGAARDRAMFEHHPSPKPVRLVAQYLSAICPVGGLVIDPFMGSGSTLVAAKAMGMRAVGWEIEGKYVDLVIRRLESTPAGSLDPRRLA